MTKARSFLAALLMALFSAALLVSPAQAADSAPITKYHVDVQLTADGVAHVTIDMVMDFSVVRGRGPYLTFPTVMDSADPKYQYSFAYSNFKVSSSTGASTKLVEKEENGVYLVRIGNANLYNDTAQQYTISYDLFGIVATNHPQSGLDEFSWNAIGAQWESDFQDIKVSITGPAAISKTDCFYGPLVKTACASSHSGKTSTFSLPKLPRKTAMQVVAGFPVGTFPGVTQKTVRKQTAASYFELNPATGTISALGLAAALTALVRISRRQTHDEVYLDLTPGLTPAPGQEEKIGRREGETPVAVQFHPPKGATPGEIGTLINASVEDVDIAATIVDLAVRGFLRIESSGTASFTLRTTKRKRDRQLTSYERLLLTDIFRGKAVRHSKELRKPKFRSVLPNARKELYRAVVAKKWFKKSPQTASAATGTFSLLFLLPGSILLTVLAASVGWGLVGIPLIIFGAGLLWLADKFHGRTALGSAMLAQAKGSELYLRTAEKETLRLEENQDIFSKYLPYAMVFGIADRWTNLFAQLNEEGLYHADTSWYIGSDLSHGFHFTNAINNMTSSMSETMQFARMDGINDATSSSLGSSGFSGGGGFGGGGGGSW